MKWIAALLLSVGLVFVAQAAGPDDQYLQIYNWIDQGDQFSQAGDAKNAVARYSMAQEALQKIQTGYPTWNPDVVKFRLDYVAEKLAAAVKNLPPSAPTAATPAAPKTPSIAELQQQIADLGEQVRTLGNERAVLEKKLKEALSVQPKPADASDVAKAQQEIQALKKENESLTTSLAQERSPAVEPPGGPITDKSAKKAVASVNRELKAARKQLESAKNDLEKLHRENAELKKKASAKEAKRTKGEADREIEQLKAKVVALQASPVVYTPEEMAVVKSGTPAPASFHVVTEAAPASKKNVRSVKDLPPGAGAMMAEGQRLFVAGEFETAEKKYKDILAQDEKNVYVLTHLANAQMAQNHLDDCEKNLKTALSVDPDDPAALFLLGNLRLRQEKVDEALDALSRSASLNSTNAVTQNSLGSALSRKGLDKAAESAFRKALQLDPGFPEAHHNIAIVYATQKPPSFELARWHYKKALDLGQPKNPNLEKLLEGKSAGTEEKTQ